MGAVTQRTFVYLCRGFGFPLDDSEREAAGFTVDESGAVSFFNLAEQNVFAMTQRALVNFRFGVDILLDQNQLEAACLTVDKRGTGVISHFFPLVKRVCLLPVAGCFTEFILSPTKGLGMTIGKFQHCDTVAYPGCHASISDSRAGWVESREGYP